MLAGMMRGHKETVRGRGGDGDIVETGWRRGRTSVSVKFSNGHFCLLPRYFHPLDVDCQPANGTEHSMWSRDTVEIYCLRTTRRLFNFR